VEEGRERGLPFPEKGKGTAAVLPAKKRRKKITMFQQAKRPKEKKKVHFSTAVNVVKKGRGFVGRKEASF